MAGQMPENEIFLRVRDYDLAATLDSGQAFRWHNDDDSWIGVIGDNIFAPDTNCTAAFAPKPPRRSPDWQWLREYLQTEMDLDAVSKLFPTTSRCAHAVAACRGLRVLRQDPWECLASFILSSTKQIVQIRQIIALLCERFGEPITRGAQRLRAANDSTACQRTARGRSPTNNFLHRERLAAAPKPNCAPAKWVFARRILLAAARQIADGNSTWKNSARWITPKPARN